jgi:predicted dehydrogenase
MPGWWRSKDSCGGLLYWTGIHDLDTMRAITGSTSASVMAMAGPKTDDYTEYEDSIAVTLRYESGAVASMLVAEHDPIRTFEESFQISVLLEGGRSTSIPVPAKLRTSPDRARSDPPR